VRRELRFPPQYTIDNAMKWKNFYLDNHCFFITSTVNGRLQILNRVDIADIFARHIHKAKKLFDFKITAYVLMPDHWHLLAFFEIGKNCLAFNRDFKRFSSNNISKYFEINGGEYELSIFRSFAGKRVKYSVWKNHVRIIPLFNQKKVEAKINYIHMNPVKKGLAASPEEYNYSSANYYITGEKGLIEIDEMSYIW
jgi:putative transposase